MKTVIEHWRRKSDGVNLIIDKTARRKLKIEGGELCIRYYMDAIFDDKTKAMLLLGDYIKNIEESFELIKVYYVTSKGEGND